MIRRSAVAAAVFIAVAALASSLPGPAPIGVPSTLADFAGDGTPPGSLVIDVLPSDNCKFCHGNYDETVEPYSLWRTSLMAQSARDPMFWACLSVSEQEAPGVGASCLRCHTPGAFLAGRVATPGGSSGALIAGDDFDGVTCNFCHRMVDPIADPANPAADTAILASLAAVGRLPQDFHNGHYVVDPEDVRRGPYDLGRFFNWHPFAQSPFHRDSALCGTCHDNSNALFTRVGGPVPSPSDTYVLDPLGLENTARKHDLFPQQRTYSEWTQSAFAQGPIDLGGKFGGVKPLVASCQDCHLPDANDIGCNPVFGPELRPDMPLHALSGANTWVLDAVLALDAETDPAKRLWDPTENSGLDADDVAGAKKRNGRMLRDAAELAAGVAPGGDLVVRVTNDTGHKLPTGFAEGRRMWLEVRYTDAAGNLVDVRGAYDPVAATLDSATTKVWEIQLGVDAAASAATGAPEGPGFHYVLSNVIEKDNRIPPRGFTNAGFASVQAHPVGATYADGQYWDDTSSSIPARATSASVRLWYQTTTREFVEFLRDENTTDARGDIAYGLWDALGRSAPFLMEERVVPLGTPSISGDVAEVSVSAGGEQVIAVDFGPAAAGQLVWVLGSLSGTSPGLQLGSLELPLVYDPYTERTIFRANELPLLGGLGWLDGAGRATARFHLPPGAVPSFVEAVVHHAAVAIDPATLTVSAVTPALRVELRP